MVYPRLKFPQHKELLTLDKSDRKIVPTAHLIKIVAVHTVDCARRDAVGWKLITDLVVLVEAPAHHHPILHVLHRSQTMIFPAVYFLYFQLITKHVDFVWGTEFNLAHLSLTELYYPICTFFYSAGTFFFWKTLSIF